MKWSSEFDPWLCAGILQRIDWTSKARVLEFWNDTMAKVQTGDVVIVLRTPVSLTPVVIERARKEVVA